ncbi:MAG: patatin-like phospholipase family protein [Gammaproteobacteria bacterium]|nr:patatin-like phospholipase family protein [Gammaproteobacteria bacterium]
MVKMLGWRIAVLLCAVVLGGCAKTIRMENKKIGFIDSDMRYSIQNLTKKFSNSENVFIVNFSGGGTRAAALSYGVLEGLNGYAFDANANKSLLDEISFISSVSGGSFTAAYYGLHGKKIFNQFEDEFLNVDFQGSLLSRLFSLGRILSDVDRTEAAIRLYDKNVFKGATFADMVHDDRPIIIINASDLGGGIRFSFIQRYFDLLCSELATFPVARAVAASSAVPLVFSPVVLRNHDHCGAEYTNWIRHRKVREDEQHQLEINALLQSLSSLNDKQRRAYIHLVDGGITDNLGFRAIFDLLAIAGDAGVIQGMRQTAIKRMIILSVDASVDARKGLDQAPKEPSIANTLAAMSNIQLHRYNIATIELLEEQIKTWAEQLSTPEQQVEPFLINISLNDVQDEASKARLQSIPTSLSLSKDDVSLLIETGKNLLHSNAEMQRLLDHIGSKGTVGQ